MSDDANNGDGGAPRSHTSRVVDDLGQQIVSGQLSQGSLLPGDQELLTRYGVSRTVLREALRTLAGKGLIQPRARVGTRVRDRADWNLFDRDLLIWQAHIGYDDVFLTQMTEMRLALEPEAAALAADRRSDAQLEEIFAAVDGMREAGTARDAFAEADLAFHLAISVAAGNPFLRSIATLIEVALIGLLTISSPAADIKRHRHSVGVHRAIAEAIARRDAEGARQAMRVVIDEGFDAARQSGQLQHLRQRTAKAPRP